MFLVLEKTKVLRKKGARGARLVTPDSENTAGAARALKGPQLLHKGSTSYPTLTSVLPPPKLR